MDDAVEGKSHTYAYDMGGNLTSHRTYPYTTGAAGSVLSEDSYAYGDSNWRDKLTAYNGQSFRYDAIGNPLTWRDGITFTWQHGRQLQSYNKNGISYRYRYDEDGNRMSKQTGDTLTRYYLNGSTILAQKTGSDRMDFLYDEAGRLLGFKDNGTPYYYRKNL